MFAARSVVTLCIVSALSVSSPAQTKSTQPTRTEEPTPPQPYLERAVTYTNATAGVALAGVFTRPNAGGPFPAVLLIPGAGAQDRDATIAGHKPFRVLADYLTRRGIAVLRVDRRGIGASTGDFAKATTQDFASDAEAGVRYLSARPDVDAKRLGLIGHGEGAIIAPMLAGKFLQISFIVLLAAPAVPGEQLLLEQRERAERAAHMPQAQIVQDKNIATLLFDMAREGKKERDIERALSKQEAAGGAASLWKDQIHSLQAPWLRFFLRYDPVPALQKLQCPVLALEGEKDMDVSPDQNVPALKAAFARGGNKDATVEVLPGLNYLFQTADTGLAMEYQAIVEDISPAALEAIGAWIAKHTSPAPTGS